MKACLRGTEIFFDITGMQWRPEGNAVVEKPVLFMLHGGPGADHLRYKQHSLELEEAAQLVFIDHRGCGRSKKTKQRDYTLKNNVEDIEALRKHLGLKKICLLGTSYGGMVAQAYAARYPKNLSKLILVVTAPSHRFIKAAQANLQRLGNAKQHAIAKHLWNGTFKNPQHVRQFISRMESLYSVKQKSSHNKTITHWNHEALNEGFGNFLRHFDLIPQLKKIKCPTLILAGQEDWICPPSQAKEIAKAISHAHLKIFKNCGHMLASDAHKRYIKTVKQFLSRS